MTAARPWLAEKTASAMAKRTVVIVSWPERVKRVDHIAHGHRGPQLIAREFHLRSGLAQRHHSTGAKGP